MLGFPNRSKFRFQFEESGWHCGERTKAWMRVTDVEYNLWKAIRCRLLNKTVIYRSKDGYKVRMQKCNLQEQDHWNEFGPANSIHFSLYLLFPTFFNSFFLSFIIPTLQIDSQISIDAICLDLATSELERVFFLVIMCRRVQMREQRHLNQLLNGSEYKMPLLIDDELVYTLCLQTMSCWSS